MAVRSRVRTTPRSRAKATARALSGSFGPPARRSASARSRSRLRVLGDCGVPGSRGKAHSKFGFSPVPGSHLVRADLARTDYAMTRNARSEASLLLCATNPIAQALARAMGRDPLSASGLVVNAIVLAGRTLRLAIPNCNRACGLSAGLRIASRTSRHAAARPHGSLPNAPASSLRR
jgi:hypothetical protein